MNREELLKLHEETCAKCLKVMVSKNHDYSGGADGKDALMNFKSSAIMGVDPLKGLLVRVMDKLQRVRTFSESGALMVENEGVDDAFEDVLNYMILAKAIVADMREPKKT